MDGNFSIESFDYPLPDEKIARFPLAKREESKLLLWKNGNISHHIFREAPSLLPPDSMLVFNDTRVIAARLQFKKETGAAIEVFLLHPESPIRDIATSMTLKGAVIWQCLIGNKKRWKDGELSKKVGTTTIAATWHDRGKDHVKIEWDSDETFAELIDLAGVTPLPPYLNRQAQPADAANYQTVYSAHHGAVAAPTAGLHFTNELLDQLKRQGIKEEFLTLHVSAGTFRPVEKEDFRQHDMHYEQVVVKKEAIENIYGHHGSLIAVGTTSLRILESIYWFGVLLNRNPKADFLISQTLPYEIDSKLSFNQSLEIVLEYLVKNDLTELHGETGIFIYPPYRIRSAHGLFTNYHLPRSTLLLLIAAFTDNHWKSIYDAALMENYRFLSYGDSSLLLR
ncbi:MAG: S-adenosylmethionine:tRNA ribosyltransferase-isomerase [Cyclobacteriaceae bacterium]|nr:S-adenosylmethionine:tRNA ribosyltransferase-isomerase [Cyclobacteriaceae bacterium]